MKYIELEINDKNKQSIVLDILKKYSTNFINNKYVTDAKKFKLIKKEILILNIGLSISKNTNYVIIREKMGRIVSRDKYVTYDVFNKFFSTMNAFITEQIKFNLGIEKFIVEQKEFNAKQLEFNAKQESFNAKQLEFNAKQESFNAKQLEFITKQEKFNNKVDNYINQHLYNN